MSYVIGSTRATTSPRKETASFAIPHDIYKVQTEKDRIYIYSNSVQNTLQIKGKQLRQPEQSSDCLMKWRVSYFIGKCGKVV